MYLDENGFIISGNEIISIIFLLSMIYMIFQLFIRNIGDIGKIFDIFTEHDDYPGSTKFSKNKKDEKGNRSIEDVYLESSDLEREEKMIFEENISGVPFRYDEKTRVLTIGERYNRDGPNPIEVNLDSFDDFREFVDRLEEYIDE